MYCHDWDMTTPPRVACDRTASIAVPWSPPPTTLPAAPPGGAQAAWGGQVGWLWPYLQNEAVLFCPDCENNKRFFRQRLTGTTAIIYGYLSNAVYSSTAAGSWANHPLDYFRYPSHLVIFLDGFSRDRYHVEARSGAGGSVVYYSVHDSALYPGNTSWGGPLMPNATVTNYEPPSWGSWTGAYSATPNEVFEARHTGGGECLFLDGHVGPLTPSLLHHNLAYYFDASGTGGQKDP
jgi:prepilin-type processing-associated H-X9-DG protein